MGLTTDSMNQAANLEAGAADGVEAALAEKDRGSQPFSIGLLLDAVEKERASLESIEQSMETLRLSLAQRRRTIDQQEEILRDLSECLRQERKAKNATGR
jgi:hypothetical protein